MLLNNLRGLLICILLLKGCCWSSGVCEYFYGSVYVGVYLHMLQNCMLRVRVKNQYSFLMGTRMSSGKIHTKILHEIKCKRLHFCTLDGGWRKLSWAPYTLLFLKVRKLVIVGKRYMSIGAAFSLILYPNLKKNVKGFTCTGISTPHIFQT